MRGRRVLHGTLREAARGPLVRVLLQGPEQSEAEYEAHMRSLL